MNSFIIQSNAYLSKNIQAYYHQDYTAFGTPGNPDYINYLKNQFGDANVPKLQKGIDELKRILEMDLPKIRNFHKNINFIVCVIPRAKMESFYSQNQKLFKKVVSDVVDKLSGFYNGTTYIIRHANTRTTHMNRSGYGGDGNMPYPGITKDTCKISDELKGKDILLIDDIYTKTINIDEDVIQALFDKGAKSVLFYSLGKTTSRY
jgi:predicted amidophosphoribosyltransferase